MNRGDAFFARLDKSIWLAELSLIIQCGGILVLLVSKGESPRATLHWSLLIIIVEYSGPCVCVCECFHGISAPVL